MLWLLVPVVAVIMVAAGLILYNQIPVKPHKPPVVDRITIPVQPLKMKVVAVIIDDVGHSPTAARPFIEMDHPVALSILPERPFSRELALEAAERGKTILLHLPMEPVGYPGIDPGPGAILLSHTRDEIREVFERDIASIPRIVGINNHMGSRATTDPRVMETVLDLISERGLFFIDSRTTPETIALKLARELGILSARRDVFLDNELTPSAIDVKIDELLNLAAKKGWAIGIGHANTETAQALERMARKANERNIRWISLESLVAYVDPGN
ncbi:divergent polysaccharide deacetylase family protein [bacterium]|nr:divergent polysaccharide deacetylase family protein [bacterium]